MKADSVAEQEFVSRKMTVDTVAVAALAVADKAAAVALAVAGMAAVASQGE